ncbi:Uncharacterised protein [Vibrio cholerae]|nr:Uncharacterised protein [Vibrio cholerae]
MLISSRYWPTITPITRAFYASSPVWIGKETRR